MTVKELRDALKDFEDNLEVMTERTEIFGNVAHVNSARQDTYTCFGIDLPCILLTDKYESEGKEWTIS